MFGGHGLEDQERPVLGAEVMTQADDIATVEISTSEDGDSTVVIIMRDGSRRHAYPVIDLMDISVVDFNGDGEWTETRRAFG